MAYVILGVRGFRRIVHGAPEALDLAESAAADFGPLMIWGPTGRTTVQKLRTRLKRPRSALAEIRGETASLDVPA